MTKRLPRVRTALQINMHPSDMRYVIHTLPHQLRVWANQVDRVCLTLDTSVAKSGRYRADQHEKARAQILEVIRRIAAPYDHVMVDEVDYCPTRRRQIEEVFFSQAPDWPDRAYDGGPFRVYFDGLLRANADFVLHMDSDMLFGGGSESWIEEAISVFSDHDDALFVCPFAGLPLPDGEILTELHMSFVNDHGIGEPTRVAGDVLGYRFNTVSTRIFMIDMQRFTERVGSLSHVKPKVRQQLRAIALAEQPYSVAAEEVLSISMASRGLSRIDWLGEGEGMFSLHPPYRNEAFYEGLPDLIERIEGGDIPEEQRGDCDVNSSMIDWSSALKAKRGFARWKKGLRHFTAIQIWRLVSVFERVTDIFRSKINFGFRF